MNLAIVVPLLLLLMNSPWSRDHFRASPSSLAVHQSERVIPGADRLLSEYVHLVKGKNVALVSNHSGRLTNGTHLVDTLFRTPSVTMTALFGMEFNIRSNDYSIQRDNEKDFDPQTGIVKYSLYGETHKPTAEMLKGVDVIVFEIQEVGARFYEHINILGFVMEAAAENNVEVVVLDRPNPLTGRHFDGFLPDGEYLFRFGSYASVPVVHGATMGELAQFYSGEKLLRGGKIPKLHVIPMKGWKRSMWFDQTGLEWRKPSPNLLTLKSVLAYAGTCLFEGLNISEGRGTDRPFEYVGAPWIDNIKAAEILNGLRLPGISFEPVEFTPEKKPYLGRAPELSGQLCRGIFVNITDRDQAQPYRAGIALVWAFNKLHSDKLVWDQKVFERLTAKKDFVKMIRSGATPQQIFSSWEKDLQEYTRRIKPYLLYE
jgi:uncharacterized protein YbbC (DUF1343 family)